MKLVKARSCLGCMAVESPISNWGTDYCTIGYETKKISPVAGHYGRGGDLISCNCAPVAPCPKPRTCKAALQLQLAWMHSNDLKKNAIKDNNKCSCSTNA